MILLMDKFSYCPGTELDTANKQKNNNNNKKLINIMSNPHTTSS